MQPWQRQRKRDVGALLASKVSGLFRARARMLEGELKTKGPPAGSANALDDLDFGGDM
jgi:hypothetical protein